MTGHWEHWAGHLGLQNWRPRFTVEQDEGSPLSIDWQSDYNKVSVWIRPKDNEIDLEGSVLSQNVLHEQVHLLLHRLKEFGSEEMGRTTEKSVLWRLFRSAEENGADTVTSVIARLHAQTGCTK